MKDEIKEILDKLNKMIIFNESLIGWQIDGKGTIISKKDFKILRDCITNLQQKYEQADNDRHKLFEQKEKALKDIDLVIELIKQQPTEDDSWILNKLNGFKYLLNGGDKSE